jgi:hypothetical protein
MNGLALFARMSLSFPGDVVLLREGNAGPEQDDIPEGNSLRLQKRLKGDLDSILLMALRKEPSRRYNSAEQLGEDLRRHMENVTVVARQPTLISCCKARQTAPGAIAAAIWLR